MSDRVQGTTDRPFGCSRSHVTVAVSKLSRAVVGADFWPADARAACAPAVDGAGAADGVADGVGAVAGSFDVSARGSPASDCAVGWAGFTDGAAGAAAGGAAGAAAGGAAGAAAGGAAGAAAGGAAGAAAGGAAGAAAGGAAGAAGVAAGGADCCCADTGPHTAQHRAIKLIVLVTVFKLSPSWPPAPVLRRACPIPPPNRRLVYFHRQSRCSAQTHRALFAAVQGTGRTVRPGSDAPERN